MDKLYVIMDAYEDDECHSGEDLIGIFSGNPEDIWMVEKAVNDYIQKRFTQCTFQPEKEHFIMPKEPLTMKDFCIDPEYNRKISFTGYTYQNLSYMVRTIYVYSCELNTLTRWGRCE